MIQKVFLIDDDHLSMYLTRFVLNQVQFANLIDTYGEAKLALHDILSGGPGSWPEAIFLDLNMPEMDGWAFLEGLQEREQELAGQVKIYILTSSVDQQDQQQAARFPLVSGFLLKPFNRTAAEALKQELSRQAARL
jgi:two-component system, chemotaxis family, chemotaxis protein CheY